MAIDSKPGWEKLRSRFGLQRFLQMDVGDRVVVPSWGTFHVFDVVSDERLIAGDQSTNTPSSIFFRKTRICLRSGGTNSDPSGRAFRKPGYTRSAILRSLATTPNTATDPFRKSVT